MLIRDALPDELAEVGELRLTAYGADGFLSPDSSYAPRLRDLGADGVGQVLVAVADEPGPILGTVMLQPWRPDEGHVVQGPDEAEIRALAVRPAAQRAGVGRALLAAVVDLAVHDGVRHLVLLTQPDMKAAHRLYELAGFTRLADRDWSPEPGTMLLAYGKHLPDGE
jgi:ribosomal protein S18 acetylase RimI-like enzyme